MGRGRPRKDQSTETSAKIPYRTGLIERTMTPEEAEKYGVTIYNGKVDTMKMTEVEWFSNEPPSKDPTIGFSKTGQLNISEEASTLMNLTEDDRLEFGYLASPKRVFVRKSPQGLAIKKLSGGKLGTGFRCHNKRIIKWLMAKKIEMKRYLVQSSDDQDIYFVEIK